jgi:GT2 family glycosyltransferase
MALSWSLVVATYNRRHVLGRCLRLAATQTRPPLEVVVVDSSPDWEVTREMVLKEVAGNHPAIRWEYVQAQRRCLTAQRNQGIRLARSDVVFLIDDDSLMYPNCAEEVMRLYDADPDGVVAGVMANEEPTPPDEPAAAAAPAPAAAPARTAPPGRLRRWIDEWKDRITRWLGVQNYLLPYDEKPAVCPLPDALQRLHTFVIPRLYGAWMTWRRRTVEIEPFEEILDAYAYLEDSDVSYRAARHGLLLIALDAKLCHLRDPSGRLSTFTLATLGALNALVLHRLYGADQQRSMRLYRSFLRKQLVLLALGDLAKRRWSLPRARGIRLARRYFPKVFGSSEQELRQWYPQFQAEFIAQDKARNS